MTLSDLDRRLMRFRSRGDEHPHALASALIDAGRSQEALEVVHLAQLGNEGDAELCTLEGRALYEQGELPEAQSALVRAAKAKPDSKEPYRWLAQVLIERGDPARAVQVLERALSIDPNDGGLRQAHGRAQRLSQRAPEARRSPSDPPPRASQPGEARARESSPGPAQRRAHSEPPRASQPGEARAARRAASEPPARGSIPGEAPASRRTSSADAPASHRFEAPVARGLEHGTTRAAARGFVGRAANQNAVVSHARARGHEALAEDLSRDPELSASDQGARAFDRAALPFDDDVERDDESPTTAVEVSEELRSRLRGELPSQRPPRPRHDLAGDQDDEDDEGDSQPTSIVPAAAELELLRAQAEHEAALAAASSEPAPSQPAEALARPGEAEPPEQVLALLAAQGVFEPLPAAPAQWVPEKEVQRPGMSLTRALLIGWLLAMLAAVGGYYGFDAWLAQRRAVALELVAQAHEGTLDGQYPSLLTAEHKLNEARRLDPKALPALEELLFVQSARALDGTAEELGPVRESLSRAEQAQFVTPLVSIARTLAQPGPLDVSAVESALGLAEREAGNDARATYLAGRLAQRAGKLALAEELLDHATSHEPRLALAFVALAEQARAEGKLERARELFAKALGPDGEQLRAELWLAVTEPTLRAEALAPKLDALASRVAQGSPADRLLAASARALAELAAGRTEPALQALRAADVAQVGDPEPLAFFAELALRAGDSALAQRAARAAHAAGGGAPRYQALLASVLLQQGQGEAALGALGAAGAGDGALVIARAAAALLTDARDALERAKKDLAGYRATADGKTDPEATALLMRVDMRLGANSESLLPAARALAQRAPTTPATQLALGDALLRAEHGAEALTAFEAALKLAPGSADAHFLKGQAEQLVGRPAAAHASLERALSIAPNHREARRVLGQVLLDAGEYDAALNVFRGLEGTGDAAQLGVIEAMLGLGKLDEAGARIAALPAQLKTSLAGKLVEARFDIARGKAQAAVEALYPLVDEHAETRTADALVVYGDALYVVGKVDAAAFAYDGALELDDEHPDALIGRATCAVHAEKADQALALVQRAESALTLRARPARTQARVLVLRGRALLGKGQLPLAREVLERAVAMPNAPAEAQFWYGELLARAHDAAAPAVYEKYLQLEPNGVYVARAKRALGRP